MGSPFKDLRDVLNWESHRMGIVSAASMREAIKRAEDRETLLTLLLAEAHAVIATIEPESTEEADALLRLQLRNTQARHAIAMERSAAIARATGAQEAQS